MAAADPGFDVWHVAVPVSDLERAEAFWVRDLGFVRLGRDESPSSRKSYVAVREGGFAIELFEPQGPAKGAPPKRPDHLAFECRDLAGFRARLAKRGVKGLPEIDAFGNGVRMLDLVDPEGMSVQFFEGRAIYEAGIRAEASAEKQAAKAAAKSETAAKPHAALPAPAASLLQHALSFPGAYEDHPWGETVAKVAKKVFCFLGVPSGEGSWGLSVKLPASGRAALEKPFAQPTGYGLGKSGWVSARFEADDEAPLDLLRAWVTESYLAVAPAKLSAGVAGGNAVPAARPAGKPPARPAGKASKKAGPRTRSRRG